MSERLTDEQVLAALSWLESELSRTGYKVPGIYLSRLILATIIPALRELLERRKVAPVYAVECDDTGAATSITRVDDEVVRLRTRVAELETQLAEAKEQELFGPNVTPASFRPTVGTGYNEKIKVAYTYDSGTKDED